MEKLGIRLLQIATMVHRGTRRFTQVSTSDDDEAPPPPPSSSTEEEPKRKRKKLKHHEEEKEEKEHPQSDEDETVQEDAKPVGEVVRVSGKGRGKKNHYKAMEYDGNRFDLEDPVLLTPEDKSQKPYVAIIKDITQAKDGSMMVTGQWFYRPEEAEKKGGGNWEARDTRELFYSFHRDEVPAESVMHKCIVHFVPLNKQLPIRKQHPGFIVQKVYDTVEQKLWKLTDKDYEDSKQHEIDILVQKTMLRLGELPDIEAEDTGIAFNQKDKTKNKRLLKKNSMSPLDVSREDEVTAIFDQFQKAETPGSCTGSGSEFSAILSQFDSLTGEMHRDKWLEKLLQGVQFVCHSADDKNRDDKGPGEESEEKSLKEDRSFLWPDAAVPAVAALEKASHDALSSDFQKYNQKMRQLVFNLKNNSLLAKRMLNGELEPSKILNMSPNELKDGLTAEETATKEPDEFKSMQMTDARCRRCTERKVGLRDIIKAGLGDRYQLECTACGNTWYASRDEVSTLTIDGPNSAKSLGTAPWATSKFEDVEKNLLSPRESDKSLTDTFKKTTEPYMPVLEIPR